jgi:hypothetical protein
MSSESSKHVARVYPSLPFPGRESSTLPEKSGRVFHLKGKIEPGKASWREINAARDAAWAAHVKTTAKASKAAKSRGNAKRKGAVKPSDAACHSDISSRSPESERKPKARPQDRRVKLAAFKRGVLVVGKPAPLNARGGKRGSVNEFSTSSRIRCAWAFLNAETEWQAMVTLTYPASPNVEHCRADLAAWLKRVNRAYPGVMSVGWCIEATKGGRPHFHVFFGDDGMAGKALSKEPTESIVRKGKSYRVCRGAFEKVAVESWLGILRKSVPASDWTKTEAFQWGGIVELLNSSDAAARYVSKEASKRTQKGEGVSLGKGCFWRLSRHLKPKARWLVGVTKEGLSKLPSYSRLFDKAAAVELGDFARHEDVEGLTLEQIKEVMKAEKTARTARSRAWIRSQTVSRFDPLEL